MQIQGEVRAAERLGPGSGGVGRRQVSAKFCQATSSFVKFCQEFARLSLAVLRDFNDLRSIREKNRGLSIFAERDAHAVLFR